MVQFKITASACGTELYRAGSYGQFTGDKYFIYVTVGTLEQDMDAPVKSVRFSGEEHLYLEKSAQDRRVEGATSYWDFKFGVADMVMGQKNVFSFVGKFYFETEKGTVYTFENNGSDFVYNDQTACDLLQSMQAALRP